MRPSAYKLPDKAPPDAKDTAHTKFQEIAFAYAILSDERRRKRYDTTGNTSESLDLEDDDFNWTDFFRAQWADTVTSTTIGSFKDKYQGSDEERQDVLLAYAQSKGKLNFVFSHVMLSSPLHDEDRFRGYIDTAIKDGVLVAYDSYTKESQKQRNQRQAKAKREAKEAEEHAKKLGKYESIFGDGASKPGSSQKDKGPDLVELIQQRQKGRADAFLDDLEARYAAPKKGAAKSQNGKKRKVEEPPEELFQTNRQKMQKAAQPKVYGEDEEEIDLENDTPISGEEDEDDGDVKPAKTKKRPVRGAKGKKKKGTAQKK